MQMRFFIEVAKHQNISKAAENLFRTQSAITRGIQELEKQLEVQLFERHPQGVLLSATGHYILARVQNGICYLQQIPALLKESLKDTKVHGSSEPFFLYNQQRLKIFLTLCLTKSMRSTAQLLQITQPAVSAAIKILEQSLKVELFERSTTGIKETPLCQLIKTQVQLCLNEFRPLRDEISSFKGQLQGVVHVGALPLIRADILPQVMGHMTIAHPGIHFVTNESAYEILSAQLRVGDIDFIIGAIRPDQSIPDFKQHILFSEDMIIVLGKQHPLLQNSLNHIQLNALLEFPWILPRAHTPSREMIQRSFEQLGFEAPLPTVETGDHALIRGLLQTSHLIAIVSRSQMQHELQHGSIVELPIKLPDTDRKIGISYRKHAILSTATQIFLDQILTFTPKYKHA
ncbi:LysR family transcriptional regulator [Acinetobacter schindleri]|uniref:LysR family transcriptional regulator n=2 Tax=Acinetobacter schindleri TaxID=108981 RepID=A0AAE7BYT8_9GAMM|nr:LysR family transcriptional regulator [Acinetobacter schindleri]